MKFVYLRKNHLIIFLLIISSLLILYLGFQYEIKQFKIRPVSQSPQVKITLGASKNKTINNASAEYKQKLNPVDNKSKTKVKKEQKEFFVEYRLERDRNRDRQIELLREIVNNANSGDEARKEGQNRILNISKNLEKEMELENLIRARGYKDVVAMIQEKSLTVIVQIANLTAEDTSKITEVAEQSTGIDRAKIVVLAKM